MRGHSLTPSAESTLKSFEFVLEWGYNHIELVSKPCFADFQSLKPFSDAFDGLIHLAKVITKPLEVLVQPILSGVVDSHFLSQL